jgi:hypothetical protein
MAPEKAALSLRHKKARRIWEHSYPPWQNRFAKLW